MRQWRFVPVRNGARPREHLQADGFKGAVDFLVYGVPQVVRMLALNVVAFAESPVRTARAGAPGRLDAAGVAAREIGNEEGGTDN